MNLEGKKTKKPFLVYQLECLLHSLTFHTFFIREKKFLLFFLFNYQIA